MTKRREEYWRSLINNQQKGWWPSLQRMLLLLLSLLYGAIIALRNWLYDYGWFRLYYSPVPLVISIGNIAIGGTGKTPLTLLLAEQFYMQFPIAILSRGYKSTAERAGRIVTLCEGHGPLLSAKECGDEPVLLAKHFPKAFIYVGRSRRKAAEVAARAGVQIILLDDGMQHRHLARDIDIVLIDGNNPFGYGSLFPRGLLRESPKMLRRAHLIVINHVTDNEHFQRVKESLEKYTKAPICGARMEFHTLRDLQDRPVQLQKGSPIGFFCGIAQPDNFRRLLETLNYSIVHQEILADHDFMNEELLLAFAHKAQQQGAQALLCTEKDRVKLVSTCTLPLPLLWVEASLKIVEGIPGWNTFLHEAKKKLLHKI